jgi:hypothetical protein
MLLTHPEAITREFTDMLKLLYRLRNESKNEERLDFLLQKEALDGQDKQELPVLYAIKFHR